MSRLARAVEILEAINKFYQEGDCTAALSGYALILGDDITIAEAIAECVGTVNEKTEYIPRSKQRRWAFHFHSGYTGWIGKKKVKTFVGGREEAERWVNEQ